MTARRPGKRYLCQWVATLVGASLASALMLACETSNATPGPVGRGPTWTSVDLPGQHSGFRSAIYDGPRNCVWIMSRQRTDFAADPMFVVLTRVNIADHSAIPTSIHLPATGYNAGFIALDSTDRVWMAWGKSLVEYDPDSGLSHSYALPSFASLGVQVHLYMDGTDGYISAMTLDSTGEVWVTAHKVAGVFGFNPARGSWDRTLRLTWFPGARLAAPRPGVLTLGLARSADGKTFQNTFALLDTSTGRITRLAADVSDYVVTGTDEIIYADFAGNLTRLSLLDGSSTVIASKAPIGGMSGTSLAADGGQLWFSFAAYRSLGVAVLDLTTGLITQFPFAYIKDPGKHLPGTPSPLNMPCPPGGSCIDTNAVFDAGIQAIVPDERNHIWVVTEVAGASDPNERDPIAPVVELQPSL